MDAAVGFCCSGRCRCSAPLAVAATPTEADASIVAQPTTDFTNDPNTSDIIVETLMQWSVTNVFGVVGDGINPLIEALRKRRDKIAFIPARREEAAAFMAWGFAKRPRPAITLPSCCRVGLPTRTRCAWISARCTSAPVRRGREAHRRDLPRAMDADRGRRGPRQNGYVMAVAQDRSE